MLCLALVAIVLLLVRARRKLIHTTLLPAWSWTLVAAVAPGCVELAGYVNQASQTSLEPWRYAAAILSLCPVVAQLGAKRPQHQPWNFIVVSLWGVLALPALENLVLQPGEALILSDARGYFLAGLLLIGPGNLLATRFTFAALVAIAAQVVLLLPYLPFSSVQPSSFGVTTATVMWLTAILFAYVTPQPPAASTWDRLWLDFRDQFGLLWGLRLQERVNTTAEQSGWNIELSWSGFVDRAEGKPLTDEQLSSIENLPHNVRGLLRRFCTQEWISERQPSGLQSDDLQA